MTPTEIPLVHSRLPSPSEAGREPLGSSRPARLPCSSHDLRVTTGRSLHRPGLVPPPPRGFTGRLHRSCCARRLQGTSFRSLAQRAEVTVIPGSPRRARAPAEPLPCSTGGPLVPGRSFPPHPTDRYSSAGFSWTGATVATGTRPGVFSTTSSPNCRAFRRSALTCFSFIWASYSS